MDDPFLPWAEQQEVADGLGAELFKYEDRGHFMNSSFPELLRALEPRLKALVAADGGGAGGGDEVDAA
jgi:predicted alpha/beta hydrolase family esterase